MHKGLYPQKGITFIVFYNKYKNIHKRFHMIERRIYIYIYFILRAIKSCIFVGCRWGGLKWIVKLTVMTLYISNNAFIILHFLFSQHSTFINTFKISKSKMDEKLYKWNCKRGMVKQFPSILITYYLFLFCQLLGPLKF